MLANEGFEKGLLSTTQKLGIIYILPKEDKCREYLGEKLKIGDQYHS